MRTSTSGRFRHSRSKSAALEAGVDATPFVRQLAWREFYHHLLFHRRTGDGSPDSPLLSAFRSEDEDPDAVAAWREGRTGIPVVDAGMRQLAATGWLSNRARLVVASFLTRHLLMDYRIGERHFMRHLIDGDVANNRGGWQWTAGVGADPQPWFRIFNPVRQGLRFDPEGAWVRRWVPELAGVADRHVHAPWEASAAPDGLSIGRRRAGRCARASTGRVQVGQRSRVRLQVLMASTSWASAAACSARRTSFRIEPRKMNKWAGSSRYQ